MFYVYILYSVTFDRYYIGHCENIDLRLERHNNKMVSSTKPYVPWSVVYSEQYQTRQEANKRELYIKRMKSRAYIERLVKNPKA